MTIQDITELLDEKIEKDENKIVVTFYEIRVKNNLSEEETNQFLRLAMTRLENLGYKVYLSGAKYIYNNVNKVVEPNELLVAIK